MPAEEPVLRASDEATVSTAVAPAPAGRRGSNGRPRRGRSGAPLTITADEVDTPRPRPRALSKRDRRRLGQLRARRVRRVVRRIDPWSVLKFSLLFYFCLFVVVLAAGTLLWNLAASVGTIDDIEGLIEEMFVFESFELKAGQVFWASALLGLIGVIVASGLSVLVAVLFNLISDLVGGVRITVLEEDPRPTP